MQTNNHPTTHNAAFPRAPEAHQRAGKGSFDIYQEVTDKIIEAVPARIVWTRFCNSGSLSHGISLANFKG